MDRYLQVRNGTKPDNAITTRDERILNELNPGFYRVIELPMTLPENSLLEIAVWDRDDFKPDELIGLATIDVEERVLANDMEGAREELSIFSPKHTASQVGADRPTVI